MGVRGNKPKTVIVFGVFDLLHPGHVTFLHAAKRHGDRLVVVVTRDSRVRKEKGRAPIFSLHERIATLKALKDVDDAVPGDHIGKWTALRRLRPDIICIGHDQNADRPEVKRQLQALNPTPKIVRIKAFNRAKYASSKIRNRLKT